MSSRRQMLEFLSLSRLPAEFQEVEYLESTGTQYILPTIEGTTTSQNPYKIIVDAQYTQFSQGTLTTYIIGAYNNGQRIGIFENPNLTTFSFSSGNVVVSNATKDLNRHKFVLDGPNNQWFVDNVSGSLQPNTNNGNGQAITIFAYNSSSGITNHGKIKLYSCKIYNNNILVRNLVPCYRKADNVAGLYDLVNGVFYTNAGTGIFIVGGNV